MKRVLSIILVLCAILSCLSGCTYSTLNSEKALISQVEKRFPDARFVSVSEEELDGYDLIDSEYKNSKLYTFKNDDFEFHVYDILEEDMWGLKTKTTTDYYEKVFELKKEEMDSLFESCGIPIYYGYDSYTKDLNGGIDKEEFHDQNPFMCEFEFPMIISPITHFVIYFYITEESQINQCVDFLSDWYKIVEDYMPEEESDILSEYLSVVFWTSKEYLPDDVQFEDYWHYFSSYEEDDFTKYDFNFDFIRDMANSSYQRILENKIDDTSSFDESDISGEENDS